jgi:hypothetical protein
VSASDPWYVIREPAQAHGVPGKVTVSQKPFPPGSTIVSGPYNTQADAQQAAGTGLPKLPNIPNPLSGVDAIGHFFSNLTDRATVIRIAEVFLGIGLIWIGVLALARDSGNKLIKKNLGTISKAAPGVAKVLK